MLWSSKSPRHPRDAPFGALDTYRVQECKHLILTLGPFPELQPFPRAVSHPSNPQKAQQKSPHSISSNVKTCWSLRDGKGPFSFEAQTICFKEGRGAWTSSLLKHLCWDTVYTFVLKDKYTLHHSQSGPLPFPKSNPVPFRTNPTPGLFFNPMHPLILSVSVWICYCGFSYTWTYRVYDILGMAWFT